jgi:hypothetical protein
MGVWGDRHSWSIINHNFIAYVPAHAKLGMSGAYPAFKSAQDSGNDQATSSASKHLKPETDIQSQRIYKHISMTNAKPTPWHQ